MRIQIASDLHHEILHERFPGELVVEPAPSDVLVLAGDIDRAGAVLRSFRDWPVPVIYVAGNHEHYRGEVAEALAQLREQSSQVHFLENRTLVLAGVRFVGATLWTDFELPGYELVDIDAEVTARVLDFRVIRFLGELLRPSHIIAMHRESRRFLEETLAQPFAGPTVVVTHHAPHQGSIHERYLGDPVNLAFASDLDYLMGKADLWIHGHMHDSFDYRVRSTRIVANPRGYALNLRRVAHYREINWENRAFDPRLVLEV